VGGLFLFSVRPSARPFEALASLNALIAAIPSRFLLSLSESFLLSPDMPSPPVIATTCIISVSDPFSFAPSSPRNDDVEGGGGEADVRPPPTTTSPGEIPPVDLRPPPEGVVVLRRFFAETTGDFTVVVPTANCDVDSGGRTTDDWVGVVVVVVVPS
jgi:hypothetical protein